VFGQVLTAGQGQNPARQAAIAAGIPDGATAWGLNQVCGSGLRTVAIAAQQIQTGDATVMIAGGQENMTLSPHCAPMRAATKWATTR
jgi:acetyl-CoA C-acetyltransferase